MMHTLGSSIKDVHIQGRGGYVKSGHMWTWGYLSYSGRERVVKKVKILWMSFMDDPFQIALLQCHLTI